LHHFFEAQVRSWLGVIENVFVQRTCPSKKRDLLSFAAARCIFVNGNGANFFFSNEKKKATFKLWADGL
jgi:hypothetical protein